MSALSSHAALMAGDQIEAAAADEEAAGLAKKGGGRARGAGVCPRKAMVASLAVPRPWLLGGHKFDMRVYVLIPSLEPLLVSMRAFQHRRTALCVPPLPHAPCLQEALAGTHDAPRSCVQVFFRAGHVRVSAYPYQARSPPASALHPPLSTPDLQGALLRPSAWRWPASVVGWWGCCPCRTRACNFSAAYGGMVVVARGEQAQALAPLAMHVTNPRCWPCCEGVCT
jgi:hypothetical protein